MLSAGNTDTADYQAAVDRARADDDVVGAVLVGSRAIGLPFLRDGSDWDLRLIVRDHSFDIAGVRHGTPHGSVVEVAALRWSTFAAIPEPDSSMAWDRPSYVEAVLEFDKLGGAIRDRLSAIGSLSETEATATSAEALDGYVNSYYRSLKNAAIGERVGAHLDAAESIGPLLTFLFAIRGRVRPFNRHLRWALDRAPLGDGWLAAAALLVRLESIVRDATPATQAGLFRDVEALAREVGHGAVIDSWEPDVGRLRRGE